MTYKFPPQDADIAKIRESIEQAKDRAEFDRKLRECIIRKMPRYGITDPERKNRADSFLKDYIPQVIDPEIQRIMLDSRQSPTTHTYYQMPSPSSVRPGIKRYDNVSLFIPSDRSEFETDVANICRQIFAHEKALKLKTVAILNFLVLAFWHQWSYLTEFDGQRQLRESL